MTDKLITHDEARTIAQDMLPKQVGSISSRNKVNKYFELDLYFKQQEQRDRDIARFLEVIPKPVYRPLHGEAYDLYNKLSKGVVK